METDEYRSAGDSIPADCEVIRVRIENVQQLFNTIDPTPFHERDLDPNVEEFIVEWAREISRHKRIAVLVHLDERATATDEATVVRDAIHRFFARRASSTRARLRQLFRRGRISLVIGLAVLSTLVFAAQFVGNPAGDTGLAPIIRESMLIGGWVAMWRPLEVFLYDWWPIRDEARLYDRLATAPVRLSHQPTAAADA